MWVRTAGKWSHSELQVAQTLEPNRKGNQWVHTDSCLSNSEWCPTPSHILNAYKQWRRSFQISVICVKCFAVGQIYFCDGGDYHVTASSKWLGPISVSFWLIQKCFTAFQWTWRKQPNSPICKTASLRLHFSTCHVQERTCPSTSSPRLPGLLISHLVLTVCLPIPNSVGRLTQLCTKESGMALFAEDWGSLGHLSV